MESVGWALLCTPFRHLCSLLLVPLHVRFPRQQRGDAGVGDDGGELGHGAGTQHHASLCAAAQTTFAVRNSVSSAEAAPAVKMTVESVDRALLCWQPF